MAELFPSKVAEAPVDASQKANDTAGPVLANGVGEDVQKPVQRTYTPDDVEKIVRDRLTRERKKFDKSQNKPQGEVTDDEPKPVVTPNVAEDLKAKLSEERKRTRDMTEKLNKYRDDSLKSKVERKLNEHNCLDPEVVIDHLMSRKLVHMDDDGELVVENATGDLDDLVRDYLAKKPHLVRAATIGGMGTKAPAPAIGNPHSIAELEQQLGITRKTSNKLF